MKSFIAHRREKDGKEQSLWTHLLEVSQIAGSHADKIDMKEFGEILGLVHDLGKASKEFDQYIRSNLGLIDPDSDEYSTKKRGEVDHSTAGAQLIFRSLATEEPISKIASQILSLCIASHHSGLIDCLTPDGKDNFKRRMCKPDDKTNANEAIANLDESLFEKFNELISDQTLVEKMSDKLHNIAKLTKNSPSLVNLKLGLLTRFLLSCLVDADRQNTADFERPYLASFRHNGKYCSFATLLTKLNKRLANFEKRNKVDELREKISSNCFDFSNCPKGIYQLTVPTGGGKTFASLRFALNHANLHDMDRVIYFLPYTSIIDQNAEEVRKIFEQKLPNGEYTENIVLEHHSNLTPDEETCRQSLLSQNWDAQVIFTTVVQFLEAIFGSGTRSARRMHQLANSVLIFDEIQTIPIQCIHLFNGAIRFLVEDCGSTVVLCTATQPLLDKLAPEERSLPILPQHQIVCDFKEHFRELKRVVVHDNRKLEGWTQEEVCALVRCEMQKAVSTLVIVNTKQSAQTLYKLLKSSIEFDTFHLSTSMCPIHRLNTLNTIKSHLLNKKPIVCISTQLIEAGVDIDFGSVIRYLAGLDSIAQAAGRCNRHGLRQHGDVFIINPREENITNLKDIKIGLEKAERVLDEFKANPEQFGNDILSPDCMELYYKYYFHERKNEMSYLVNSDSIVGRSDNLFELLSTNTNSLNEYSRVQANKTPKLPLRQSFQTAANAFKVIDQKTRGIIVPYGIEGKKIIGELASTLEIEHSYKLLKKAQRYSVNVYSNVFEKLAKSRAIFEVAKGSGIFYLIEQFYSEDLGLCENEVEKMSLLMG